MGVVVVFWAFCFGLVFGSFFNVVIYRLPRGLSLVKPGSSCPKCGHRLSSLELIPLFSFLWQRGACKACGARISRRYPLVEFLTGLGFALIAWTSSAWTELIVGLVFLSLLLVLAFIDLDHKLLPNVLTLPGVGVGLLFSLLGWTTPVLDSLFGAIVGFVSSRSLWLSQGAEWAWVMPSSWPWWDHSWAGRRCSMSSFGDPFLEPLSALSTCTSPSKTAKHPFPSGLFWPRQG